MKITDPRISWPTVYLKVAKSLQDKIRVQQQNNDFSEKEKNLLARQRESHQLDPIFRNIKTDEKASLILGRLSNAFEVLPNNVVTQLIRATGLKEPDIVTIDLPTKELEILFNHSFNCLALLYSSLVFLLHESNKESISSPKDPLTLRRSIVSSFFKTKNPYAATHSFLKVCMNPNLSEDLIYMINELKNTPGIASLISKLANENKNKYLNSFGTAGELYHAYNLKQRGYRVVSFGFDMKVQDEHGKEKDLEVDLVVEKEGKYYFVEGKHFAGQSGIESDLEKAISPSEWKYNFLLDISNGLNKKSESYENFLRIVCAENEFKKRLEDSLIGQGLPKSDLKSLCIQLNREKEIPIVFSYSRRGFPYLSNDTKNLVIASNELMNISSNPNDEYIKTLTEIEFKKKETINQLFNVTLELLPYKLLNNSYSVYKNTSQVINHEERAPSVLISSEALTEENFHIIHKLLEKILSGSETLTIDSMNKLLTFVEAQVEFYASVIDSFSPISQAIIWSEVSGDHSMFKENEKKITEIVDKEKPRTLNPPALGRLLDKVFVWGYKYNSNSLLHRQLQAMIANVDDYYKTSISGQTNNVSNGERYERFPAVGFSDPPYPYSIGVYSIPVQEEILSKGILVIDVQKKIEGQPVAFNDEELKVIENYSFQLTLKSSNGSGVSKSPISKLHFEEDEEKLLLSLWFSFDIESGEIKLIKGIQEVEDKNPKVILKLQSTLPILEK